MFRDGSIPSTRYTRQSRDQSTAIKPTYSIPTTCPVSSQGTNTTPGSAASTSAYTVYASPAPKPAAQTPDLELGPHSLAPRRIKSDMSFGDTQDLVCASVGAQELGGGMYVRGDVRLSREASKGCELGGYDERAAAHAGTVGGLLVAG